MADLLSNADFAEFKGAIQDISDTFFKYNVMLLKRTPKLAKFNESVKDSFQITEIELRALNVFDSKGNAVDFFKAVQGSIDLSEGYLLFNFDDLDTLGLIDPAKNVMINAATDTFRFQGLEYEIMNAIPTGPLQDSYALVKLPFKKKIKK